jgi:hypothetical protein
MQQAIMMSPGKIKFQEIPRLNPQPDYQLRFYWCTIGFVL